MAKPAPMKFREYKFRYFFAKELPYGDEGRMLDMDEEYRSIHAWLMVVFFVVVPIAWKFDVSYPIWILTLVVYYPFAIKLYGYLLYRIAFHREGKYD